MDAARNPDCGAFLSRKAEPVNRKPIRAARNRSRAQPARRPVQMQVVPVRLVVVRGQHGGEHPAGPVPYAGQEGPALGAAAALTAVTVLIQPVVAALLGWMLFAETMTAIQLLGGAALLGGVLLAQWSSAKRKGAEAVAPAPL